MTWLLLALWTFAVGAIVGSFLNVVVYRVPRGMNIVWPGSHCPACKRPIAWYDNIPVLSWLVLRGKCRRCGAPISARYPVVEALTGGMFLLVGLLEFSSGATNLWWQITRLSESPIAPHRPLPQLAATFLVDMFVLSAVLASALIQFDGGRPPRKLFVPAMVLAAAAAVSWPEVHPVPEWFPVDLPWAAALDMLIGFALGMAFGLAIAAIGSALRQLATRIRQPKLACPSLLARVANQTKQNFDPRGRQSQPTSPSVWADPCWLAAGCIGGQFGVAAAVAICGLALIAVCVSAPLRRQVPPAAWLLVAALVWIAAGLR